MTTEVRRLVADAVEAELISAGRDRRWIAAHAGIAPGTLDLSLGLRRDFTVGELADIAAALDIPVERLAP